MTGIGAAQADKPPSLDTNQPITGHSLETLLERACAADPDPGAWQELIRRYGRLLVHTARRVGLNDSDAAEVTQLAWIRLWERGHQIREPASLAAWLTATVRRESLRVALRNQRYLLSPDPSTEHGSVAGSPDHYPVEGGFEPWLEQALRRLPPQHEQLIRLLISDASPSYLEAARSLGLPIGSIGPMRMRALRILRDTPELAGTARLYQR